MGIDCVPITKRAQQTVSEVTSNGDKIRLRREEKLREREKACEKMKEILGVDVTVKCKVDEWQQEMMNEQQELMNDDNDMVEQEDKDKRD